MTRLESRHLPSISRLLGSLLFAVAFNLAFALALGSLPTQAQRYAMAQKNPSSTLAQAHAIVRHRTWYA